MKQADATLQDVVRVIYILPNGKDFEKCWPTLRKYFGDIKPASTMISAGLANEEMKIGIVSKQISLHSGEWEEILYYDNGK